MGGSACPRGPLSDESSDSSAWIWADDRTCTPVVAPENAAVRAFATDRHRRAHVVSRIWRRRHRSRDTFDHPAPLRAPGGTCEPAARLFACLALTPGSRRFRPIRSSGVWRLLACIATGVLLGSACVDRAQRAGGDATSPSSTAVDVATTGDRSVPLEELLNRRFVIVEVMTLDGTFTPAAVTTTPYFEITSSGARFNAGGCNELSFGYTYAGSRIVPSGGVRTQAGGCVPREQEDRLFALFGGGPITVARSPEGFVLSTDAGSVTVSMP